LPLKAKKLKALACVLGVLFSVIIALTVLQLFSHVHLPGSDVKGELTQSYLQKHQHNT
jgi:hypothetical protein